MDKCVDKDGMPAMDSRSRGDLGYISNVANDLLPEALASKRELPGTLGNSTRFTKVGYNHSCHVILVRIFLDMILYIDNLATQLAVFRFLRWLDIELWESSQKYFTQDAALLKSGNLLSPV